MPGKAVGKGAARALAEVALALLRFDELVIVMFVGGRTMTLPRKIWDDLVVLIEPTQAAASTVLIVVSTAALGLWALLQRRS
jgi:ABC-type spermidine/putrescine transport system permease subunit II